MADYAADISSTDYIYIREISITETGGEDRVDFPIKLTFDSSNFTFEFARSDGKDVRVGERSNGTQMLNMWLATWDTTNRVGVIWLKIPSLLANETKALYVYFGNSTDTGISDVASVGFLFADGFDDDDIFDNLALSKTCEQSTTNGSFVASRAVDGNINTFSRTNNAANEWWKVDLGAVYSIGAIDIAKEDSIYKPTYYYIQTADDYAFTVNVQNIVTDNNESGVNVVYDIDDFGSVSTRYLRIYCHTVSQYMGLAEVRVYIDNGKWTGSNIQDVADSKIRIKTNGYIEAKGTPLSSVTNWIVEDGIYLNAALTATDKQYYGYRFYGTENDFGWNFYGEGSHDRRSNLVNGSTWTYYNGTEKGLEGESYSENSIAYNDPNDKVYQSMARRDTYADYTDSWERQVSGDTRATYFRIYGRNDDTAPWVYIDWVIVREYFETDPYSFDTSNLRPPWELITHQTIDWTDYDDDITSTDYYHSTSSGGDPYKLSDNIVGSNYCWHSDEGAASGSVELVIDFARGPNNLVSDDYIHYDSGHVGWKNASKLSTSESNIWGNDYFHGTTTSGYICIDFGDDNIDIGCFTIKGHTTSSGMVKNFIFKGSYVDPRTSNDSEWDTLYTDTFVNTTDWQTIYFVNGKPYRYYKLDVLDTYNNGEIILDAWGMYKYNESRLKRIISQVRLLPVVVGSDEVYFPKQIELKGSNGLDEWDTLITTSNTYTPFFDYIWGRWQRHSFTNTKGYYCYKLTCIGNWNDNVGKMGISEWEMREKALESHTHRVLAGSSNNFNNIWADDNITFDSGFFYVANDGLNIVYDDRLLEYTTISGSVLDINVI